MGHAFRPLWSCVGFAIVSLGIANHLLAQQTTPNSSGLSDLREAIRAYSGTELVFSRDELPDGKYHDVMKPLPETQFVHAASILLEEVKMYPPGYLGDMGLKTVGIFAACASKSTSDKRRTYDAGLGGYRYFGVYNGSNAIAASFYDDGQLRLTLHHEIYHHVDSTIDGQTARWQLSSDDALYQAAITGMRPYQAPPVAIEDLKSLKKRCIGITLKNTVSKYAAKNWREDQAETARHVMSNLANSLVQTIEQPELPGSQRILHILGEYEGAVPDGPAFDWFVDVALKRADPGTHNLDSGQCVRVIANLAGSPRDQSINAKAARAALKAVVRLDLSPLAETERKRLLSNCAKITKRLLVDRLRPNDLGNSFKIWGYEDSTGANRTLRRDVHQIALDAKRLGLIRRLHGSADRLEDDVCIDAIAQSDTQLNQYLRYINRYWDVSPGTRKVFQDAKAMIADSQNSGNGNAPH